MRGAGGPLLTIGDLLNDVGEADVGDPLQTAAVDYPLSPTLSASNLNLQPSDLSALFQENYDQLKEALAGTDHSWTALTLKLCIALDTADKLVQSSNSHVELLSKNIRELERVIKRGDSVVGAAKSIHNVMNLAGVSVEGKQLPGSDQTEVEIKK